MKVSTVKKSVKKTSPILITVCSVGLGGTVLLCSASTKKAIRQAKSTVLSKYHVEVRSAAYKSKPKQQAKTQSAELAASTVQTSRLPPAALSECKGAYFMLSLLDHGFT